VEFIVVMVVIGILASIVASFITSPVRAYLDTARRATLTDIANTALLRIARDARTALPNSVRVAISGGRVYLEYLPVRDGGRYRLALTGIGSGDVLDFASGTDTGFDVLGPAVTVAADDHIVIYNLGLDSDSDAYQGGNRRAYAGAAGSVGHIAFTPGGAPFPLESPGQRFYVVGGPVTYVCDPAAHTLRRYSGYAIQAAQPADVGAAPLAALTGHLLADQVSACDFRYAPGASQRLGQLTLWLRLEADGEALSLYREVLVNNDA
jgi:MSHA biogenesis protein MshO